MTSQSLLAGKTVKDHLNSKNELISDKIVEFSISKYEVKKKHIAIISKLNQNEADFTTAGN